MYKVIESKTFTEEELLPLVLKFHEKNPGIKVRGNPKCFPVNGGYLTVIWYDLPNEEIKESPPFAQQNLSGNS
jgi:hypothetical protein